MEHKRSPTPPRTEFQSPITPQHEERRLSFGNMPPTAFRKTYRSVVVPHLVPSNRA